MAFSTNNPVQTNSVTEHFVIVGGGQAAAQAVQTLRQHRFGGTITLVGDEPYPPYQRPPLSKSYLAGALERERLFLRPRAFYEDSGVELELGIRAMRVDPGASQVTLEDDRVLRYDGLMLATGSRVRRLRIPGADLRGVHYVRTVADVDSILADLQTSRQLVVVGGGYIGLEVAAVAASCGLQVTLLEAVDRVMARVVSPEVSGFFRDRHTRAGVRIRCATTVSRFVGGRRVTAVETADGQRYPCDAVIVGIGIVPAVGLAEAAGLACDDGIMVDEFARTEHHSVLAAGDCTNHPSRLVGERIRLESVQNAIAQARTAALTFLGQRQPYAATPWFWSDQYELKLQIAGLSQGHEQVVVRGAPDEAPFAVFYLRAGRLIAVEAVNSPKAFMLGKKLISAGTMVEAEQLADVGCELSALLNG